MERTTSPTAVTPSSSSAPSLSASGGAAFDLDFLVATTGGTVVHRRDPSVAAAGPEPHADRAASRRPADAYTGVSIDGRNVPLGGVWFAIRGERLDGHQFIGQAAARGAAALVVVRGRAQHLPPLDATVIEVDEGIAAVCALAAAHRLRFPSLRVVAVAGSHGKTTVRDMLAASLGAHASASAVLKSDGRHQTPLTLALTLLELRATHRYAVLEMGTTRPGDITRLAALARPDVGVVVSLGVEHLQTFGGLAEVARAEAEIFAALPAAGVAVYPFGDELLAPWAEASPAVRRIRFGRAPESAVRVLAAHVLPDGTAVTLRLPDGSLCESRLSLVGLHNAQNAAAAAAAAYALGLPAATITAGLPEARSSKQRSALIDVAGRHILDDCYNASPPTVIAALDTLADFARQSGSRSIAVLGDVLELGPSEAALHRAIGAHAAHLHLDLLVAVGRLGASIAEGARAAGLADDHVIHVDEVDDAAWHASKRAKPGDWVLLKASRGARLEKIVEQLREAFAPPPPPPPRPVPPPAPTLFRGTPAASQQKGGPVVTYKRPGAPSYGGGQGPRSGPRPGGGGGGGGRGRPFFNPRKPRS